MKKTLTIFDDICKSLGIRYYLLCGTCLGIYREGRIFPGDNDIDVFVDCNKEKIVELFEALDNVKDIGLSSTQGNKFKNAEGEELNRHVNRGGHWLDVYFKMLDNRKPFMKKGSSVEFNGRKFNLPHPVEEYLDLEYGEGKWKIPGGYKCRGKNTPLYEHSKEIDYDKLIEDDLDSSKAIIK